MSLQQQTIIYAVQCTVYTTSKVLNSFGNDC